MNSEQRAAPDAEMIVYTADDIIERMSVVYGGDDAEDDADLLAIIASLVNKARRPPLHDISIACMILDGIRANTTPDADSVERAALAAAGDADWLDDALNRVHPGCYIDGMKWFENHWRVWLMWPTWMKWPVHGTGATRKAAILNAVEKALEVRG